MKKIYAGRKFFSMLLCLFVSLTLFSTMNVSATSATSGSAAEYSEKTTIGEVINSVEQGATGTYSIAASGYYLINLRGADGGDGQDVHIETDGVGSTDECKGNAYGYGGSGASGGNVSTLVYLKKGQTLSYSIGSDGTNYVEEAYRFEDLQRGCIHVYPNSNPIYKPNEYVDAGYGGGGGSGTWISVDNTVIAGAAGGGGGGGSVAACANWGEGSYYGFKDPSKQKNIGANGGNATDVSSIISETFTSIEKFNGHDGEKSRGESVQTGEYWPAVTILWKEIAPKAPKYELTEFEAGAGGSSGTSYINKDAKFYYGDNIPSDVSASDAYLENEPHMWNVVSINGYNYHIDVTSDISLTEQIWQKPGYFYYLISDKEIKKTHQFTESFNCVQVVDNPFYKANRLFYDDMSDGQPTDEYQSEIEKLKKNGWFKNGTKTAIAIGNDADKTMLAEFTENSESVIEVHNAKDLAKVIKFVSITSSQVVTSASSSIMSGGVDDNSPIIAIPDDLLEDYNEF